MHIYCTSRSYWRAGTSLVLRLRSNILYVQLYAKHFPYWIVVWLDDYLLDVPFLSVSGSDAATDGYRGAPRQAEVSSFGRGQQKFIFARHLGEIPRTQGQRVPPGVHFAGFRRGNLRRSQLATKAGRSRGRRPRHEMERHEPCLAHGSRIAVKTSRRHSKVMPSSNLTGVTIADIQSQKLPPPPPYNEL